MMIALSLMFQLLFAVLLMMPYLGILQVLGKEAEGIFDTRIFMFGAIILICALSCFEYFRRGKAAVSLGSGAAIFFLFPRGLDRIFTGEERIKG
jgi:hypothetical protein